MSVRGRGPRERFKLLVVMRRALDIYVHDVYGAAGATAIGRFGCTGQVFSQKCSLLLLMGYMAGRDFARRKII